MTIVRSPSETLRVLVIAGEQSIRKSLSLCLEVDGHHVASVGNSADALTAAAAEAYDLIFVGIPLGTESGLDLIPLLLSQNPWVKITVVSDNAAVDAVVDAFRLGAIEYLPNPVTPAQVEIVATKVARQRQLELNAESLRQALGSGDVEADFVSRVPAFCAAVQLAQRVAPTSAAVLIRGEIGTGRDRLARAMHVWSGRSAAPLVAVSCHGDAAALEAELFGTAESSLAGPATESANSSASGLDPKPLAAQTGRVELAAGGTLLLKEITETPICLQPKLVRLLRDHEYERQGDFTPCATNLRVIATTSQDLQESVHAGKLRPDLAQALDIVTLDLPPLRERRGDIPDLAQRYLAHFARIHGRAALQFSDNSMDAIKRHAYPGNSTELRNLIERAVLVSRGTQIMLQDLPASMVNIEVPRAGDSDSPEPITNAHVREVLATSRSRESAAAVLGANFINHWRRRSRLAT